MTKGQKQTLIILAIISSIAAISFVVYLIIDRIKNKYRYNLLKEAKEDLKFWENYTETNPKVTSRLKSYWNTAGFSFTNDQLQSKEHHSNYPWSAAYVSDLILRSKYPNFKPSATHSAYVIDAKNNRQRKLKNSFWAFKPSEEKTVEIGDILVMNRAGSNVTLDTIKSGVPTHGDVVIDVYKEKGNKYALVIGGNVGNKVATTKVKLTSKDKLPKSTTRFAHLKFIS